MSKWVKRNYAFGVEGIPTGESDWLKVIYGFSGQSRPSLFYAMSFLTSFIVFFAPQNPPSPPERAETPSATSSEPTRARSRPSSSKGRSWVPAGSRSRTPSSAGRM